MNRTYVRRTVASLAAFAIAGLGMLAAPTAAQASGPEDGNQHCVARATGDKPEAVCFPSFDAALQFASDGRLTTGPKNDTELAAKVNASNEEANRLNAAGFDTVISIEYTSTGWTGSELIWLGTGNCTTSTGNIDYEIDTMPAGWVNVISSFRTFANCWDQHWEDPFEGGDHVGYTSSRSNIGALLDNKTSSQRWS